MTSCSVMTPNVAVSKAGRSLKTTFWPDHKPSGEFSYSSVWAQNIRFIVWINNIMMLISLCSLDSSSFRPVVAPDNGWKAQAARKQKESSWNQSNTNSSSPWQDPEYSSCFVDNSFLTWWSFRTRNIHFLVWTLCILVDDLSIRIFHCFMGSLSLGRICCHRRLEFRKM